MKIFMFALALLASTSAHALKISPMAGVGLEFGGDSLVNAVYVDGSKSSIEAGRGLFLRGGVLADILEVSPHTFEAEAAFGLKWATMKQARNGGVTWTRWPLELLAFYHNLENSFRLGGGISYQFGNSLKGSKDAAGVSTKFENATGLVLAGDYFIGQDSNIGLGLRYTLIDYSPVGSALSAKGNNIGFWFSYFWL